MLDSTCSSHRFMGWDIFDRACLTIIFIRICVTFHVLLNRNWHRRRTNSHRLKTLNADSFFEKIKERLFVSRFQIERSIIEKRFETEKKV